MSFTCYVLWQDKEKKHFCGGIHTFLQRPEAENDIITTYYNHLGRLLDVMAALSSLTYFFIYIYFKILLVWKAFVSDR